VIVPIELPPRRVVASLALAVLSLGATAWAANHLYASIAPPHQSYEFERGILGFFWAAFALALAVCAFAVSGTIREHAASVARVIAGVSAALSVAVIAVLLTPGA
jgi:hypothetical protein